MDSDVIDTVLIMAVAKLAGIDPEALAKEIRDHESIMEYFGQLSAATVIESTRRKEEKK